MNLRQRKSLFSVAALTLFALAAANGQTQDGSGNGLLKGNFRFRHIAVQAVDMSGNPTQVTASYGLIMFDGSGNYTVSGTSVDNTVSGGAPQTLNVTGTYVIGSNGIGYIVNLLYPTDNTYYIYGAVSQGVFTGSSTETQQESFTFNDIFIAIPTASTSPTNASFTAAYQTGLLDFAGGGSAAIKNALFKLSPNGLGAFGAISLSGQAANQTTAALTQSVTGATYSFNSDGSATLTVPLPSSVTAANALFTGAKTMFESADGNFILGWTPTGYDIFFGVKALAVTGTNTLSKGLYFTTGLEDSPLPGSNGMISGTDSFYGSISNLGDSAGNGIQHARLNFPNTSAYDFGTDNKIVLNADGTTAPDFSGYQFVFGDGGLAFVGIGTNGNFALVVSLQAAAFSGTGVYLNPVGVVNAASYQPITANLAPGELITLFGTGLSPVTMATPGGVKFPTTLGGVSVTIDSIPCPIYYVSSTQMAVVVPYALASNQTGLADIQVTNNGVKSNTVQMYFSDSAPGAFSQNASGLGSAAAVHALTGALITPANPAQPEEYISLFLTGLGTVTPAVPDGSLGPTSPLSVVDLFTSKNLTIYFNDYGPKGTVGNVGNIQFAGLAPGLAGLYQINVQVPKTGLASGDNVYIEFQTDRADVNQIQIPYGTASPAGTAVRPARRFGEAVRPRAMQRKRVSCTTVAHTGARSTCIH